MKIRLFFILLSLLLCQWTIAQQTVSSGKLIEYSRFNSTIVPSRNVFVWLPTGYSTKERYDVLYMHDGQMLFDANTTWNNQEWGIDKIVGKLLAEKKMEPCIVVGIASIPETRYEDYFPQKALNYLPDEQLPEDISFNADNYLRFLVEEVKPFIDKEYSTNKSVEHTFVMGSSMGGLISLYALCEYPEVFGGAACMSTHVPMILSKELSKEKADQWSGAFRNYLDENLPTANSCIIYMDRGDATLDAYYPPYQDELDKLMRKKGWKGPMWVSRVFPGAAHTEVDWNKRLDNPLLFLLGTDRKDCICDKKDTDMSPDDYLISKFKDADIVLLAEDHGVKENLDFVRKMIPKLYANGIYMLGMEFGAYEDQKQLDSLINAPRYNENLARQLMFNYNTRWAIVEYMNLYKAAWEWNHSLPEQAKKFRVLNISYRYNWKKFEGARTPENMKQVFPLGNTEDFRCALLEREVLAVHEKILVLTGTIHAFTSYRFPYYDYTSPGFVRYENRFLGNLLYDKYGNKVVSVALHQPFFNYPNQQPTLISPAAGKLELIMEKSQNNPIGFDLKGSHIGELHDYSYYSMGHKDFILSDLFDGYIFLKPIRELSSCTVDYKFMNDTNWNEAVSNSPDPDWQPRPHDKEEYWRVVENFMNIEKRYADVQ